MEIERAGKSYTAETIKELKMRFPDDELVLLMGTDMFLTFHQWRHPEIILANASLARLTAGWPPGRNRPRWRPRRHGLKKTMALP